MTSATGWMPTGFQAMVFLVAWTVAVLAYGIWRSMGDAEPDPIRPAGPPD